MLRALLLVMPLLLLAGCCAQGPGYMEDVTLAARADQEIDLTLPLHPNGDAGRYYAVNKSHLPQGLDARIEGDVVRLTGTLPAGQYSFGIGLEEAPGNACANWAGYHVDLAVTASP